MISRAVEISIAGGGGVMVRVYLLVLVFLFFCNHVFIVLRYKRLHAVLGMAKTKPINHPQRPASPLHGKNQAPRINRKRPPHLSPKIKTPDT